MLSNYILMKKTNLLHILVIVLFLKLSYQNGLLVRIVRILLFGISSKFFVRLAIQGILNLPSLFFLSFVRILWKIISLNSLRYSLTRETDTLKSCKSFSEAFILASVNPQYDERLFIELQEKYKFRRCCVKNCFFILAFKTIFVQNMF